MVRPLLILFLLGALQGLIGWIMVQSGLDDSELVYVSHYKLAIHFVLALGLLCYTLWFALQLLVPNREITYNRPLRSFTIGLTALLTLQLIYGAFMAGLRAGPTAPTWPKINSVWWPTNLHSHGERYFPGITYLFDHPLVIHFIHRGLAYILTLLIALWCWRAFRVKGTPLFEKTRTWPLVIVLLQLVLGILATLTSPTPGDFLWVAVAHQFVAMFLLLSLVWMVYIIRGRKIVNI
jgi:cytochrome c oxidase assembly protein subunit 15